MNCGDVPLPSSISWYFSGDIMMIGNYQWDLYCLKITLKTLNLQMIFPSFSNIFPPFSNLTYLPSFSHHVPIIFPWFSQDFPMVFLWFSQDCPIFPWFSQIFPWFSHVFSTGNGARAFNARARLRRGHKLALLAVGRSGYDGHCLGQISSSVNSNISRSIYT